MRIHPSKRLPGFAGIGEEVQSRLALLVFAGVLSVGPFPPLMTARFVFRLTDLDSIYIYIDSIGW